MPFKSGWGFRKEIKYGTVFPDANLTDFPKLFKITTDADIAAELGSGGGITVTGADGETVVPFGLLPSSAPASGTLLIYAQFSPLTGASTGDTIGYLYYDSGQSTTEDKAGVMDGNYALFMPLEEDPSGSAPQMYDWVSESNIGTSNGTMTSGDLVAGQVGNGLDFDGSDDYISMSLSIASGSLTAEVVANMTSSGSYPMLVCGQNFSFDLRLLTSSRRPEFAASGGQGDNTATTALATGTAYHVCGSSTAGSTSKIYVNGALENTSGGTGTLPAISTISIGRRDDGFYANGVLEQVRVSDVARSADWIAYTYDDLFTNSDTFSLGSEEAAGGGGGASIPALDQGILTGGLSTLTGGIA